MDQLCFTISFKYEIIPASLHVPLSADIEMIGSDTCLVQNIRRVNMQESSLLPVLKLKRSGDYWVHMDSEKESNISKVVGEAIDLYLEQLPKRRDEMRGR